MSTAYPPLRDAKISFYDDYHIMSGIPVFVLHPVKADYQCEVPSKHRNPRNEDPKMNISFFNNPDSVTACNFSLDNSRVASGPNDGTARIWSTEHGTVVHIFEEMHKQSPVADIRFFESSNTV